MVSGWGGGVGARMFGVSSLARGAKRVSCLPNVRQVWAGPLSGKKWAVALLNRDPQLNATITVSYTMFNATAASSFAVL